MKKLIGLFSVLAVLACSAISFANEEKKADTMPASEVATSETPAEEMKK